MPDTDTTPDTTTKLTAQVPVELTAEQKEAFFKAFLADKPYEEEFSLLGGNYRIKLKSLTIQENNDILKQIAFDREQGRIDQTSDYYYSRVNHYRLSLAIVTINDKPYYEELNRVTIPTDSDKGLSYLATKADLFDAWTMVKLAAVQASLSEFDRRVTALVDGVANPDFWKAGA